MMKLVSLESLSTAPSMFGATAFSPASIPTIALYLRADKGVTHVAGVVSEWADQSGNGRHAGQTLEAKKPAYVTENGKPMLLFDGVDDFLLSSVSLGTTSTVFVVIKLAAFNCIPLGGDTGDYALYVYTTTMLMAAGGNQVSASHGMTAGQTVILGVSRDNTSVQFWKNGIKLGSVQTLAANATLNLTRIGQYGSGVYTVNGYIGDVIMYQATLSDSQIGSVFSWLNGRYGAY